MIKNMVKFINKNSDKMLHFLVGFFLIDLLFHFYKNIYAGCIGLFVVLVVSHIKEKYDYDTYGKYDYLDILAAILGSIIPFFLV